MQDHLLYYVHWHLGYMSIFIDCWCLGHTAHLNLVYLVSYRLAVPDAKNIMAFVWILKWCKRGRRGADEGKLGLKSIWGPRISDIMQAQLASGGLSGIYVDMLTYVDILFHIESENASGIGKIGILCLVSSQANALSDNVSSNDVCPHWEFLR